MSDETPPVPDGGPEIPGKLVPRARLAPAAEAENRRLKAEAAKAEAAARLRERQAWSRRFRGPGAL